MKSRRNHLLYCVVLLAVLAPATAQALDLPVASGNVGEFILAVDIANNNPGKDRILLEPGIYEFWAPNNGAGGGTALPVIVDPLEIVSTGPARACLTRDWNCPEQFRFFYVQDSLELVGIAMHNGFAPAGGAIFNHGWLKLDYCHLTMCKAQGGGGAIANGPAGYVYGKRCNLFACSTDVNGGAVYNAGTATFTHSTFRANRADLDGGAVYNMGWYHTYNSTYFMNYGERDGGAIMSRSGAYGTARGSSSHCTFYKNTTLDPHAKPAGKGGAVYNEEGADFRIDMSAFTKNGAQTYNTGLMTPTDLYGEFESAGYNLVGCPVGFTLVGDWTGNIIGIDQTLTHHVEDGWSTLWPAEDSLLVDAGSTDWVYEDTYTDQRGASRQFDGKPDIGAIELGSPAEESPYTECLDPEQESYVEDPNDFGQPTRLRGGR